MTKKTITGTQWDDYIALSGSTSNGKPAPGMNIDPTGDIVTAGAGNDTVISAGGADSIDGGNGNDSIHGGDGNDTLIGGNGSDTVYGDGGNDLIWGDSFNNADTSANGADFLYGGDGNDTVHGGNGDDLVQGDAGNDQLFGDNGNDKLYGGAGADILTGGAGNDTFIFKFASESPNTGAQGPNNWDAAADDTITDFQPGVDKLDFTGLHLHFSNGPAAYGVWNTTDGHGVKVVEADTTGDGVPDLIIKVNAWPGSGDFIGLNHAPIAVADTGNATEAGVNPGSDATGNVLTNDSDPDGDPIHVSGVSNVHSGTGTLGTPLAGNYGSLTLNSDGSYDYVVDNSNSTVNALNGSQTLTETFTYQVADGFGGFATTTLTITIHGQNDAPTAVADTGTALESGVNPGSDANGNVLTNDTDPDNGDTLHVSGVSNVHTGTGTVGSALVGDYGSLTLNADGTYTYVVDNSNATVNAMGASDHLTDTFTYQVSDGNGGFDTTTLTITINGQNDAPTAVADTGTALEAGVNPGSDASGNVLTNDTDPESDPLQVSGVSNVHTGTGTVGSALVGDYGSLTLNADGSYDYVVDNSNSTVNALNGTQTLTDTFTYQVADGNGGFASTTLTITVHGQNDNPIAVADTGDATEDGVNPGSDATGNVLTNDSDPDNGDSIHVSAVSNVHTGDGTVGSALVGDYGSLTLNANGSYDYVVDNSNSTVNALNGTQTLTDTFTYQVADGNGGFATTTLTITIHGQNDNPIAVPDTGDATEAGVSAGSDGTGNVLTNDTDPDNGDTLQVSGVSNVHSGTGTVGTALDGDYGSLTLSSDGSYTYVVDNSNSTVNALNATQTLTDTFTYQVSDGNGGFDTTTLTITIHGQNDNPVAVDDTANVNEKGPAVVIDALANDHDPDSGDTASITQVEGQDISVGNPVTLADGSIVSLNSDGTLSYDPNGAWNSLNTGDTGHEIFSYTISDGHGGTATATIDVSVAGVTDTPPDPLSDPNDFDNGNGLTPSSPNGGSNTYNGTTGADTIVGSSGNDVIHAGTGSDLVYSEGGNDTVAGDPGNNPGGGNDVIYAGSGNDNVTGGSGDDLIYGGSGNDTIDAGPGTDTIIGGYGQDSMTGGTGADTFAFLYAHDSLQAAPDLITDFTDTAQNATHDLIDLSAIDGATAANVSWSFDSVNNVTKIIVHATNGTMEIDLTGDYTSGGGHALQASDFHFHS